MVYHLGVSLTCSLNIASLTRYFPSMAIKALRLYEWNVQLKNRVMRCWS